MRTTIIIERIGDYGGGERVLVRGIETDDAPLAQTRQVRALDTYEAAWALRDMASHFSIELAP